MWRWDDERMRGARLARVIFTVAPMLLLAAIVAACLVPALRASTVDPMVELRKD